MAVSEDCTIQCLVQYVQFVFFRECLSLAKASFPRITPPGATISHPSNNQSLPFFGQGLHDKITTTPAFAIM